MTNPRSRRVDLDDIERQLQHIGHEPPPARQDPLAELARIVGQDDPFRAVLAADEDQRDRESNFDVGEPSASTPSLGYDLRRAAAIDSRAFQAGAHGADTRQEHGFETGYRQSDPGYGHDFEPYREGNKPGLAQSRRSKKGLVTVGAVMGLAALGVGGALALRDSTSLSRSAAPPVIQADTGPLKIQPQNPGGMDIPDQNKQIYERGAPEKQTRVVNREEQPVDVKQAARAIAAAPAAPVPSLPGAASAGIVPPSTATPGSGAGPAQTGSLAASLGEPKRVKTVAIRPDGTVLSDASPARPKAATPAPGATPAAPATPPARPSQDARTTAPAATESATPARPSPAQTGSTQRDAPAADASRPTRVAALTTPAAASAASPASEAAGGGFTVQLGIRPSEEEARTVFKELQKKYPGELAGKAALIRKAEVNEKTVYRVRVGPLSREDAGALCTRLKGAGGQCFVANNN